MANRLILGKHPNLGEGLFVSRPGVDVTGVRNVEDLLFSSQAAAMGQIVLSKIYEQAGNSTTNYTINNFGKTLFALTFEIKSSKGAYGSSNNADDKFVEYEIASSTGSGSVGSGSSIIARIRKSTVPPHHQSILSIQNTSSSTQILGVILMRETQ